MLYCNSTCQYNQNRICCIFESSEKPMCYIIPNLQKVYSSVVLSSEKFWGKWLQYIKTRIEYSDVFMSIIYLCKFIKMRVLKSPVLIPLK
jgi:hypothetical protein